MEASERAVKAFLEACRPWNSDNLIDEVSKGLTAAAPHLAAVRVKKLEWTNSDDKRNDEWLCATDASPSYSIMRWWLDDARDEVGHFEVEGLGEDQFGTLEEAKAAAQADFEARILSALEPSVCKTCNGHGIIGGMYRVGDGDVDGWEKPCPDCEPSPQAQSSELSRRLEEFLKKNEDCFFDCEIQIVKDAIRALASHPVADKPDEAGAQGEGWLPQDVINLVIAAREFWEDHYSDLPSSHALDEALEAFSSRVLYENEPDALPTPPSGEVA